MKQTLKFLSSVLLISLLGLVNCHKYETGGSPTNGYLVGTYINGLVRSATTGNCAISVNLGSLYAGAIVQGAAGSATNFPQAKYEAVTGSTITAQGYTGATAAAAYATVPYNKKYDAFLTNSTDGTSWTNALRATAISTQKVSVDLAALSGGLVAYCAANVTATPGLLAAGATTSATLQAVATALFATFTTAEQTALNAAINASFKTATDGLVTSWATYVAQATVGVGLGNGSNASCVSVATSGTASFNSVVNGVAGLAGGFTGILSAYMSRISFTKGAALMACARIPRSSCTTSAVLTATREADLASLVATYQTINATPECRKPSTGLLASVLTTGTTGLPRDTSFLGTSTLVNLGGGRIYQNTAAVGGNEGSTSGFSSTGVLASQAYPKSGALLGIAASFTSAHPMNPGATPYSTVVDGTVAKPYYGGSNINVANVTSCDALGFGNYGPTPIQTTDSLATVNSKKTLTDVKEIVYAFSSNNTVAKAYELAIAAVSPATATNDAVACNRQMRKTTAISSLLGVGTTLNDLEVGSGDGGATSLVSACVYGADVSTRTSVAGILATTLPGLASCPVAASSGASSFGATGLTTYTSFPDGQ